MCGMWTHPGFVPPHPLYLQLESGQLCFLHPGPGSSSLVTLSPPLIILHPSISRGATTPVVLSMALATDELASEQGRP